MENINIDRLNVAKGKKKKDIEVVYAHQCVQLLLLNGESLMPWSKFYK